MFLRYQTYGILDVVHKSWKGNCEVKVSVLLVGSQLLISSKADIEFASSNDVESLSGILSSILKISCQH